MSKLKRQAVHRGALGMMALGEDTDCTVIAFMVAFDVPYEEAHDVIARDGGRAHKGSITGAAFYDVLKGYGAVELPEVFEAFSTQKKYIWVYNRYTGARHNRQLRCCMTVAEFCRLYPVGRYVLSLARHVLAVVDGVPHDTWNSGARRRLQRAFKIG